MSSKKPGKSRRMGSSRRDQRRGRIQRGEGKADGIEDLEVEETMPYTGQEADEAAPDKLTEHQSESLFPSTDIASSPILSSPVHLQQSDSSPVSTGVGTPPMPHGQDLMHHEEPSFEDFCLIQPEREFGTESGNVSSADLHEPEEAVSSKGCEQPSYSLGPEVEESSFHELVKKVGDRGSSSLEEASEKESKKTQHMDGAQEALPPIPNRREKRRKLGSTRKSTHRAGLQVELEETADVMGQGSTEREQSSLLEEDTEGHREDSGICTHTQEASNDSEEVGHSSFSLDIMEECKKEREMEQIKKDDTQEMSDHSDQEDHSTFVRDKKSHKEFQPTLDRAENEEYDMDKITTHDIPFEDSSILNQMDQTQDSMLIGNDSALNINVSQQRSPELLHYSQKSEGEEIGNAEETNGNMLFTLEEGSVHEQNNENKGTEEERNTVTVSDGHCPTILEQAQGSSTAEKMEKLQGTQIPLVMENKPFRCVGETSMQEREGDQGQTEKSCLQSDEETKSTGGTENNENTIPQEISLPSPLRRENRIKLGSTSESSVRAEEQTKSAGEQDVMRPEEEEGDFPLLLEEELSSEIASSGELQVGEQNEIIIHQIRDKEKGVQGHSRDTETFSILSHTPEIDDSEQAEHFTLSAKNETENKGESMEEHEKEPVPICQACDITDHSERLAHTLFVREDSHSETQVTLMNPESVLHSEAEITKHPNTFEGTIILDELNQTTDLLEGKASDSQYGNPEMEDHSPESEEGQMINVRDNSFEEGNIEEVLISLTEESECKTNIKSKEREEKTSSGKDQTVVIDGLYSKELVQAKDPVTTEELEGGVGQQKEQGEKSLLLEEELGFEVIAPSGKLWTETSKIHQTTDHEKELVGGRETSGIFSETSLASDYSNQAKHFTLLVENRRQDEEKSKEEKEMEHDRALENPDISDYSNQVEHTLLERNAIDTGHQQENVQSGIMGRSEVEIKIHEDMIDDTVILSHPKQSEDSLLMGKGSGPSTNLDASQCQSPELEVYARESEQVEVRTVKDSSSAGETAGVVLCSQRKESDYEENTENIAKEEDLSLEKCPTFIKDSGYLGILEQSPNFTATEPMETAKHKATQLPLEVESLSVRVEGEFYVQEREDQGQTDESGIRLDAKKERRRKLGSTRKSSRRAKLPTESGGEEDGVERESENREKSSLLEGELGLGIFASSGEIQTEKLKEFTIHLSTDEEKGLERQKEVIESSRIFQDTSDTSGDYEKAENSTFLVENEREHKEDRKDKSEMEQFRKNATHVSDCSDQFENEELHFDSQLTTRTESISDNEAKASKHEETVVIDRRNQAQGSQLIENRSVLHPNHDDSQLWSPESENLTQKSEEEGMGNVEVNCPQETNVEDSLFILTEEKWHGGIKEKKDTSLPIVKGRESRRKMGSTRKTFHRVEVQTETGVAEDVIGQGREEGRESKLLQEELTCDTASDDSEQREHLQLSTEKKQEHEDESKAEGEMEKFGANLAFKISENSDLGEDSTLMTVKKTDGDTQLIHPRTVRVEPSATENRNHDNIIEDMSFRSKDEISTLVGEGNTSHNYESVIAPDAKDRSAGTMVEDIVLPLHESPPSPNRAERRRKLGSTRKSSRKAELRAEVGEDEDMMGSEGKASSLLEGELGFEIPGHPSLKGPETQEEHSTFSVEEGENEMNRKQRMEMHYTPNISTHCDEAGHPTFVKDIELTESSQNEFQMHSVGSGEAESINNVAEETVEQLNPCGGNLHADLSSELTVSFYGSQEISQEMDGHTQTCDNQAMKIGQPSGDVHNPSNAPHRKRKMGSTRKGFLHSHNQAEQKQSEESREKDEGEEKELGQMYKAKDVNNAFEREKGTNNDVDLERETEIKQLDSSHQGYKECNEETQQSKRDAALRDTESTGREDSVSQEDGGNRDSQRSKEKDVAISGSMDKPKFLEPPESSTSDGMQEKAGPVKPQLPAVRKKLGSSRKVKHSTWKGDRDLGHANESGVEEDPKAAAVLQRIQDIFRNCNPEEKGFITWEHMQGLSGELGLSIEELRQVFDRLDKDKDGLVTTQDVSASFRQFMQIQHRRSKPAATVYQSDASILAEEEEDSKGTPFMAMLDGLKAYSLLQDQSEIWSLWVELQHTEPHLLKNLEDFVSKVAEQIKTVQQEKESLELALKRQIRRHSIAVKELYEEMERQITSEKEGVKRESLEKSRSQRATTEEELDQKSKEILALHVVQKQLEGSIGELRKQQQQSSVEREELLRTNQELEQQLLVIRGQLEKLSHAHAPHSGHAHQRPRPLLFSLTDRGQTEDSSGTEVLNLHSNVQNEPRRISHGAVGFERSGSVFDQENRTGAEGDARRRVISIEEDPMPDLLTGRQASSRRKQGEALWEKQRGQASGSFGGPSSELDLLYNVVLVGNSNVGKTCFLKRFQTGEFSPDFCATVGLDSCIQTVQVDGRRVILQLWDTAGQERFHSITKQILRKAQGLLLMYDITSSQSFTTLSYWLSTIQEGAPDDVIIMLLANKNDGSKREVSVEEGEALAREYNVHFMECSAATGDNVIQAMNKLAQLLKQQVDKKQKDNVTLHKEPLKKKSGCCG